MNALDETIADEIAGWFRCLSDATRLQILNLVARAGSPMTVGEIVDVVGRSQSTVSKHIQTLSAEGFVVCVPDGVRTLVRVNDACMTELPHAAARIMGVEP